MTLVSFLMRVRKPFIITFVVLLQPLCLYNFILLSKDMIYGDSSGLYLKPLPRYGFASFLHILIQILLFFVSFIYAFKVLQIEKDLFPVILLVNFCLFLTPVGLSWFERGQFSLYVSLSYLWLFLGLFNRNGYYILLSALFAYVKWTSFPFIFVVILLWLLNSKSIRELRYSVSLASVYPLMVVFLFLLYFDYGIHFLIGLFD